MVGIRKLSLPSDFDTGNTCLSLLTSDVRATVSRGLDKRSYLEDCLPFSSVFGPKNLTLQLVKASLIPANMVVLEFNKHVIECEKSGEEVDFDWGACLRKNASHFQSELQKHVSVSFIRKAIEEVCVSMCSPRIADKLTKNVTKSFARKRAKFSHLVASKRVLSTAVWGNAIMYSSFCVYDFGLHLTRWACVFVETWRRDGAAAALRTIDALRVFKFASKKLLFFSASWLSSSCGFALGSYVHANGGAVGSLVLEFAVAFGLDSLLSLV